MHARPNPQRLVGLLATTLIAALFTFELAVPGAFGFHPAQAVSNPALRTSALASLSSSFIANAGQLDQSVRFQVRDSSGVLSFAASSVTLSLGHTRGSDPLSTDQPSNTQTIRLSFDNANPNTALGGAGLLPGIANFFIGNDPAKWHTNVPMYAGVSYHDLYPGVDLAYTGHEGALKGTYTVAAGVDPATIRWRYSGAAVQLDATGDLKINTPNGVTLIEQAPVAWQIRDGTRITVAVDYQLEADGEIGFTLAANSYDQTLPLVIDPNLTYSTYLGGSGNDQGSSVAVDSSGNVYVAGLTVGNFNGGSNFPTTGSAYQTGVNGSYDAFVTKLNSSGTALVYSTFLGGSGLDKVNAITVDSSGNAYVAGYTYSADFPTMNAFQATNGGGDCSVYDCGDAFLTKLNATGSSLIYSTYLGGTGFDQARAVGIDLGGGAYIAGLTMSSNFPHTANAAQKTFGGGADDVFVAKFAGNGGLIYSTYLGSVGDDAANAIAVDGVTGNAYVTGLTSGAFPVTSGVFQSAFNGGTNDAFVAKLNPAGSAVVYSTYLGGGTYDDANAIAEDSGGNVYVAGDTASANFPVTAGAFQTVFGGGTNGFIVKLNAAGSAASYSTFLGGNSDTQATGVAIDSSGNAYVTGFTSGALPITSQAYQITMGGGGSDGFVVRVNTAGSAITYSTYLGGAGLDFAWGIARDSSNNVYVAGQTSGSFPVTGGAYQTTYGGFSTDAFVSRLVLPAQADLLRIDTIGIFRPSTNSFYFRLHNSTGTADITVNYSPATKPYPVVGDWIGSGFETIGIFDQSNGVFSLRNSNTAGNPDEQLTLGNPNDMPLAGRWTAGAAHSGVGVFRPSNGLIYLKNALTTGFADDTMVLGIPGDNGLAGDWNGDGQDNPGVYRPSNSAFYLSNKVCNCSVYADYTVTYGLSGDAPVVGDWVGQGHDGIGLFRQTNGFTYLKNALITGYADISFTYGIANDIPVAGHWQVVYPPVPPENVLVAPTTAPASQTERSNGLGD